MPLKNIFFKDEPTNKVQNNQSQNQQTVQNQNQQTVQMETSTFVGQQVIQDPTITQAKTSEVNDNIVKSLWQVLIDKNLPGPDYLEVKNNASALQAMNLPIEKCYEAGFRTLQASYPNFTKETLLQSIDTYINIVKQEQIDGKKECDLKRQNQIGDKTLRINQLADHKNDLERQIKELQAQIISTDASIEQLKSEVSVATAEIDKQEALFNNSIESVIDTLNRDKDIMSKLTI